jgi:predicted nucleic-acid-binding Zn-ribbon protein
MLDAAPSAAMKNAQQCPKCQCRKLWVMKPAQIPFPGSANSTMPLVLAGATPGTGFLAIAQRAEVGALEAWICSRCGYTEWYMEPNGANAQFAALANTPGAGVFWVDSTSSAYR